MRTVSQISSRYVWSHVMKCVTRSSEDPLMSMEEWSPTGKTGCLKSKSIDPIIGRISHTHSDLGWWVQGGILGLLRRCVTDWCITEVYHGHPKTVPGETWLSPTSPATARFQPTGAVWVLQAPWSSAHVLCAHLPFPLCLLWINKARAKDKRYIWVSVWRKTTN